MVTKRRTKPQRQPKALPDVDVVTDPQHVCWRVLDLYRAGVAADEIAKRLAIDPAVVRDHLVLALRSRQRHLPAARRTEATRTSPC